MSLYSKLYNKFVNWLTYEPLPEEKPPYDYKRLKYEIRPGDVLLFQGTSRVSSIIRYITQSPWTHAALYIGRLSDIENIELRKKVAKHMDKKENVRLLIEGLLGRGIVATRLWEYRHQHIRICRPIGLSPEDTELVIAYAIKALGRPYSVRKLLDLARFLLPWTILPRRWGSSLFKTETGEPAEGICSSLLAEAFESVQFPILPFVKLDEKNAIEFIHRNPQLFSPKDFDFSPYFSIIKYPIFSAAETLPYYRRLPWSKNSRHDDNGIITQQPNIEDENKKDT